MLKQVSVFVENKPGSLMKVTKVLKENEINVRAVASFDTPEFGILRMVVDKPQEAKEMLAKEGFVVRVGDVIAVELEDRSGSLNGMLEILAGGNISISYIYSFVIRDKKEPLMVLYTKDMEQAVQLLENHGITVIDEIDL